ncbi:MAG: permease-like cell division protein FtsX, partial [Actinomycetia bacterium]|nr:permease-like cell division protein FtsX [Actinomycetes bacterium]
TDEGASAAALRALQAELVAMPEVAKVVYVSKEQALERLRESFAGQPEIFEGLTSNPLPDCLEIYLVQGQDSASFAAALEGRPGIDQLRVEHADFDHETMLALLRGLTPSEASLGVSVPAGLSSTTTATSTGSPGGRLSPSGRGR